MKPDKHSSFQCWRKLLRVAASSNKGSDQRCADHGMLVAEFMPCSNLLGHDLHSLRALCLNRLMLVPQFRPFKEKRLQNRSSEASYALLSARLRQLISTTSLPLTGFAGLSSRRDHRRRRNHHHQNDRHRRRNHHHHHHRRRRSHRCGEGVPPSDGLRSR